MTYWLTLAISGEELAKSLDLDSNEIVDDVDKTEVIGAIRDFGEVVSLRTS